MCDYSQAAEPNRLAREGDHLLTYRFPTGVVGLATPDDVRNAHTRTNAASGFWRRLRAAINKCSFRRRVTAVCIPPGALSRLEGIPRRLQRQLNVCSAEDVTFTQ